MPEITSNIAEKTKTMSLRESAMSIPFTSKIAGSGISTDAGYVSGSIQKNAIMAIWGKQHPLIHAWFVLSSVSICFLSALFFIFQ